MPRRSESRRVEVDPPHEGTDGYRHQARFSTSTLIDRGKLAVADQVQEVEGDIRDRDVVESALWNRRAQANFLAATSDQLDGKAVNVETGRGSQSNRLPK